MTVNLATAEAAIARGDYSLSLEILKRLAKESPSSGKDGAQIRMLMVTAWMGQGQEGKAIETCRLLTRCKDPDLRVKAKHLLSVLEAPSLERPSSWSIEIPTVEVTALAKSRSRQIKRTTQKGTSIQLPPTGPTKGLQIGFATVVLSVLLCLTILLSGCVKITTEIKIPGPDQISLGWEVESSTTQLLPWQIKLMDSLVYLSDKLRTEVGPRGSQKIISGVMSAKEADLLLQKVVTIATDAGGIEQTNSKLELKEKNWLLGIKQDLDLFIDLSKVPDIPGLKLSVKIIPSPSRQNLSADPNSLLKKGKDLFWQIHSGRVNHLYLHEWKWSRLGIGTVLICLLLLLTRTLQSLRLQLGYGFPELPP